MKVLISATRFAASKYYRVDEPARAAQEADPELSVTVTAGLKTTMYRTGEGDRMVVGSVDAQGADVVVLQLPKTVEMLQILRLLQAQGVAVVVEFDDLFSAVPYGHQAHDILVRRGVAQIAEQCAREADLVTVSTPGLLEEYAKHGRGVVVPNAVPRRIAELSPAYERDPDVVTVGWSGNVFVHPYDLQEMGSGLQQALGNTRGRSRFTILGQKHDARDRMRLPEEPDEISWLPDVDAYLHAVGDLFDVGVAPLRIDRFNICKSWLKPMEYSARGIFSVRSKSPEYERLGLGYRAGAPKDWGRWITKGVEDTDFRREAAAAAREKVLAGHLTEHTAQMWVDAWRRARDIRSRNQRKGA